MKTNILIPLLSLFLMLAIQNAFSQIGTNPCFDIDSIIGTEQPNLALYKNTHQSSNYYIDGGFSSYAVDGVTGGGGGTVLSARTNYENQPWWEVNLGDSYFIRGVTIEYPAGYYPQGISDYYILFSDVPFQEVSLNEAIASDFISHIYVSGTTVSGQEIPASYQKAQYVRIQMAGHNIISFVEVAIPGGPGEGSSEICNNGIDDDHDCKIDCEDFKCTPVIWAVNKKDPTCKICNDGWIEIKAYGYGGNLQYSIDGGFSFHSCQPVNQPDWCGFDDLPIGDYDILVTNGICTTAWNGSPVSLRAPDGAPGLDLCINGGFEEGDDTGWLASLGNNVNGDFIYSNVINFPFFGISEGVHSSGWIDPNIGLVINAPIGNYFGRVGYTIGAPFNSLGAWGASIKYCMTVDANNAMNQFYYYLIFEDGTGTPDHNSNPFFEWRILDNNHNVLQTLGKFTADINDPFFTRYGNSQIVYKEWSCEPLDLQAFIGQNICIEFIGTNCDPGSHFGYAYVDGLCTESPEPYGELSLVSDVFCIGNSVNLEIKNETRFNYYKIELSRVDNNGNILETSILSENIGFSIPDLQDIIGIYESKNMNYTFNCEDKWKVSLTLQNACGHTFNVEKKFRFACKEYIFNYKDIVACLGNLQDIQMQGNTDCTGCINYQWSILYDPKTNSNPVSVYLSDPSTPYPYIKFSTNIYALGPTYLVKATTPEGCVLSDVVRTTGLPDFSDQMEVLLNNSPKDVCTFDAETTIKFSYPVHSDDIDVRFYITSDYGQPTPPGVLEEVFNAIQVDAPGMDTEHRFKPDVEHLLRGFDHQIRVVVRARGFDSPDVYQVGTCTYITTFDRESDSPFFGDIHVNLPNAFSPLIPGSATLYFPEFGVVATHPSTVYEAWMSIWDRSSGGLIHEAHVVSTNDEPINPIDLAWDGKWNGQWVANGTYNVLVDYQNCQIAPTECFTEQEVIGPKLNFGYIGNGASIKPYHKLGLTGYFCTPDPLSCTPPISIKNYSSCLKFHCSESTDCHHKQFLRVEN